MWLRVLLRLLLPLLEVLLRSPLLLADRLLVVGWCVAGVFRGGEGAGSTRKKSQARDNVGSWKKRPETVVRIESVADWFRLPLQSSNNLDYLRYEEKQR